ncbi:MAG: type II secretion system F family protein [Kiritimatiellia bacterium]|jgi:tight adherence protein B
MSLVPWIIIFTGICFAGLTVVALQAFAAGANAYSGTYSSKTARQFEDIFLFIPPRRIAEIGWICAAFTAILVFLGLGGISGSAVAILVRGAIAILLGALMLLAPAQLLVILRNRRRRRFNVQLVDALVNMGNALKSGFSIMQAIEHVVENGENPIAEEFATLLHQTRVGVSFQEAMRNLDQRVGSDDLTLVVLSIETARRTGGNLTEIFANISHTIQERLRIENRIRTLTAQGRLQGIVLSIMPIALGFVLNFIQPAMMQPFVHSVAGIVVMILVAVLLVLGALSIRKIIRIDI